MRVPVKTCDSEAPVFFSPLVSFCNQPMRSGVACVGVTAADGGDEGEGAAVGSDVPKPNFCLMKRNMLLILGEGKKPTMLDQI
jgi:hypothetical protein